MPSRSIARALAAFLVVLGCVASATTCRAEARVASTKGMSEATFWRLVEETRRAAGNDTGRQSGFLEDRLRQLSPRAIVEFERIRRRLDRSLYTWSVWGAARVIENDCSDDCFRDFRAYVISLG